MVLIKHFTKQQVIICKPSTQLNTQNPSIRHGPWFYKTFYNQVVNLVSLYHRSMALETDGPDQSGRIDKSTNSWCRVLFHPNDGVSFQHFYFDKSLALSFGLRHGVIAFASSCHQPNNYQWIGKNLYQAISSARQINCPPTNIAWQIIGFIQRDKQGLKGDEDCLILYGLGDPLSLLSKEWLVRLHFHFIKPTLLFKSKKF